MHKNTITLGIIAIITIGSFYIFYKEYESEARALELLATKPDYRAIISRAEVIYDELTAVE